MSAQTDAAQLTVKTIKQILGSIEILTSNNMIDDALMLAGELQETKGDLRELLILRDNAESMVDEQVGG